MIARNLLLLPILCLLSFSLKAQSKDSISVMKSASNFVSAFNNFEWNTFRNSFTDEATIFYPSWDQAKRVKGRQEMETAWLTIFPQFADPTNTRKLQIDPKDINVQLYGKTAIVTFHLGNGLKKISRRTLVMVKEKGKWKIAHIHASTISENMD